MLHPKSEGSPQGDTLPTPHPVYESWAPLTLEHLEWQDMNQPRHLKFSMGALGPLWRLAFAGAKPPPDLFAVLSPGPLQRLELKNLGRAAASPKDLVGLAARRQAARETRVRIPWLRIKKEQPAWYKGGSHSCLDLPVAEGFDSWFTKLSSSRGGREPSEATKPTTLGARFSNEPWVPQYPFSPFFWGRVPLLQLTT